MKNGVELISASAGSGKTHALMGVIYEEIVENEVPPEGILAITFTRKAAEELVSRVRQRLVVEDASLANRMEAASVGTLHSIAARLLSRFAYDLGESPNQRVIEPDSSEALFYAVIWEGISSDLEERIRRISRSLGRHVDDFLKDAFQLACLARQNDISPAALRGTVKASIAQIERCFSKASKAQLLPKLSREISDYLRRHAVPPNSVGGTLDAHEQIKKAAELLADKEISWINCLKLAKLKPSKKVEAEYQGIITVANEFTTSPEFHRDLSECISIVHELAAGSMEKFEAKKRSLGVIDFTDLEQKLLQLLDLPNAKEQISREFSLLLVDEFQDTNPIQLAIYLKLAQLVKRAVWVGDAKQTIYGFNGADSSLMAGVVAAFASGPSQGRVLDQNWRSRNELVEFTSALFASCLEQDGFKPAHVRLKPAANISSKLDPIQLWRLAGSKEEARCAALANKILELLESGVEVVDRETGVPRKLRPGDIGILARNRDACTQVASSLRAIGIEATWSGGALHEEPEVLLALAAYRYAMSSADRLAAAEVSILSGEDGPSWLDKALGGVAPTDWASGLRKIDEARSELVAFSPAELIDASIKLAGIDRFVGAMAGGEGRLANLAALCATARRYEALASEGMLACTPAGFLKYFSLLCEEKKEIGTLPEWNRPGAVDVSTIHRSKGLEWPVVILYGLHKKPSRIDGTLFGLRVVSASKAEPNILRPLEGREVRYMPELFGRHSIDSFLQSMWKDAEVKKLGSECAAEERRLLYVAFTRAREMLVLATEEATVSAPGNYLGLLTDMGGKPVLQLPAAIGSNIFIEKRTFKCVICLVPESKKALRVGSGRILAPTEAPPKRSIAPLFSNPSRLVAEASNLKATVGEIFDLGGKVSMGAASKDPAAVGSAVHAFLSADRGLERNVRLDFANRVLENWQVAGILSPEELLNASDRFQAALKAKWPTHRALKEWPVLLRRKLNHGETIVRGTADLLLELQELGVVIDHKTSAVDKANIKDHVEKHAPQLRVYAEALRITSGKPVHAWLHFPVAGLLVEAVFASG